MADNLLSELSSPVRIEILSLLKEKSLKPNQIAKNLNGTIQAVTRHINRLYESSLIEKTPDGALLITPVGKATLLQVQAFDFLFQNRRYFTTHSFEGIPDHLVRRIGELSGAEFLQNPMESWQRAKEMAHSTKEYFFGTAPTAPLDIIPLFSDLAKKGVKIKIVFAKNSTVPKGFNKQREKQWTRLIKEGLIEEKYVLRLPLVVCVNETAGELVFPNKKTGEIDAKEMFIGDDARFHKWCQDLFKYCWSETDQLRPFSLEER